MKKNVYFIIFSFLFLSYSSYAPAQKFTKNKIKPVAPAKKGAIKYGIASYYAKKFNGRKTSTGAVYSSEKLTAACNVLPLHTWVKVTNLSNGRSVIVHINDHLHRKNKRLIDLSKYAAGKLGFISKGITRVKVEVLGRSKSTKYYTSN